MSSYIYRASDNPNKLEAGLRDRERYRRELAPACQHGARLLPVLLQGFTLPARPAIALPFSLIRTITVGGCLLLVPHQTALHLLCAELSVLASVLRATETAKAPFQPPDITRLLPQQHKTTTAPRSRTGL
jgi:hypothetical protein